jgi:RNA polymerase sigma-70 factor, ECF subfamily
MNPHVILKIRPSTKCGFNLAAGYNVTAHRQVALIRESGSSFSEIPHEPARNLKDSPIDEVRVQCGFKWRSPGHFRIELEHGALAWECGGKGMGIIATGSGSPTIRVARQRYLHPTLLTRRLLNGQVAGTDLKSNMADVISPELPDSQLVQRAQAGDLGAFETLINRHEQRVYSLARRMLRQEEDAQDVAQQTFLSALEHLDGFRGEASFSTWLLHIAAHAALKVIRKRKGVTFVSLEAATEPTEGSDSIPHPEFIADWRESPSQLAQRAETQRLLDDALAELDEKHRLVFILRDVQGLSVKETAQALDLSEANTKVRLLRARLQLREKLTRVLGDETTQLPPHRHPEAN